MKNKQFVYFVLLFILLVATLWLNRGDFASHNAPGNTDVNAAGYLLALSWQPAFCEQRPNKAECRSQRAGRFDSQNFTLHGLWPQPRDNTYCNVPAHLIELDKSGRWHKLPKLPLSDPLRKELAIKMPGYRSSLHRHEWFKHGSCLNGASPELYYRLSLNLLDQLNNSGFVDVINNNLNRTMQFRDLEEAFTRAFGRSSSGRLIVDCYRDDGRRIIQEIKLSIGGDLNEESNLSGLLASGKKVGRSCPHGVIDPVGLQ